jgi:thiol-disulfide isomerase/thioredoxin
MANFIEMKKWSLSLVICAFLLILLSAFTSVNQQVNGTISTDPKPIKTFEKDGIKVNAYDFNSFKEFLEKDNDTTYVINFWATWCQPCVAELPNFEKIGSEYNGQKLKVLLVSLDFSKSVEKSLIPFIVKRNLKSKVVLLSDPDGNSWIPRVDPNWSGAIPATIIYNKKKNLWKFYERSFTLEELQTEIKPFI